MPRARYSYAAIPGGFPDIDDGRNALGALWALITDRPYRRRMRGVFNNKLRVTDASPATTGAAIKDALLPPTDINAVSGEAKNPGPPKGKGLLKMLKSLRQNLKQARRQDAKGENKPRKQQKAKPKAPAVPAVKPRSKPNMKSRVAPDEILTPPQTELIGPVVPTVESFQVLRSIPLSPGNAALCYGGQAYADLYEEFTIENIEFKFVHSAGTACSGDVYIMVDTDPMDSAPSTAQQLCQNRHKAMCAPYDDMSLKLNKSAWTTKTCYVTEGGTLSGTATDRQNYCGVLHVATDHITAPYLQSSIGRLFVTYQIRFRKRRPPQVVSYLAIRHPNPLSITWTAAGQKCCSGNKFSSITQRGMPNSETYFTGPDEPSADNEILNIPGDGEREPFVSVGTVANLWVRERLILDANACTAEIKRGWMWYSPLDGSGSEAFTATIAAGATGTIDYVANLTPPGPGYTQICPFWAGLTNASNGISIHGGSTSIQVATPNSTPELALAEPGETVYYQLPENQDAAMEAIETAAPGTMVAIIGPERPTKLGQVKIDEATVREVLQRMRQPDALSSVSSAAAALPHPRPRKVA